MAEKRYTATFEAKDRVSPVMEKIAKSTDRARDAKGRFIKASEAADKAQDRLAQTNRTGMTSFDRLAQSTRRAEQHIRSLGDRGLVATRGLIGGVGRLASMLTSLPSLIISAGAAFGTWKLGEAVLGGALQQEMTLTQLQGLAGSEAVGNDIFKMLKGEAQNSTFSTAEYTQATRSYLGFTKDQEELKGILDVTKRLALLDPVQGFSGASFAVKEGLSGDLVSLAERFELPKSFLRQNGFDSSGDYMTNYTAIAKTLDQMGMTSDAVDKYESTGMSQWQEFRNKSRDFLGQMGLDAVEEMKPFFQRVNSFFGSTDANRFASDMSDKVGGLFKSLSGELSQITWEDIEAGLVNSGNLLKSIGDTGLVFMDAMSGGKGGSPVDIMRNFVDAIGEAAEKISVFNDDLRTMFNWIDDSSILNGTKNFFGGDIGEKGRRKGLIPWLYEGIRDDDWSWRRPADGSHRAGLSHVPFDGYMAELHEGERVLTKQENRNYGQAANGQVLITGNTFHVRQESDINAIGQALVRQLVMRG